MASVTVCHRQVVCRGLGTGIEGTLVQNLGQPQATELAFSCSMFKLLKKTNLPSYPLKERKREKLNLISTEPLQASMLFINPSLKASQERLAAPWHPFI